MNLLSARYPSLADRHVVVSGGASGIGEALVKAFCDQHCKVSFLDVQDGEHLAARWPGRARHHACDVTDIDALQAQLRLASQQFGPVDVLINNAAQDQRRPLLELKASDWEHAVNVNLRHYAFAMQAVIPQMKERGHGVILNMGSISWRVKSADMPAYTACKAALAGLTRPLAREFGAHGIRINTLSPGATLTERQAALWRTPEAVEKIQQSQSLKGDVMPSDIAAMALFLCSDDARMCTGQEYIVDGGWA